MNLRKLEPIATQRTETIKSVPSYQLWFPQIKIQRTHCFFTTLQTPIFVRQIFFNTKQHLLVLYIHYVIMNIKCYYNWSIQNTQYRIFCFNASVRSQDTERSLCSFNRLAVGKDIVTTLLLYRFSPVFRLPP